MAEFTAMTKDSVFRLPRKRNEDNECDDEVEDKVAVMPQRIQGDVPVGALNLTTMESSWHLLLGRL